MTSNLDWNCYLIKSCDGKRTYIGATNDVQRRLQKHNGYIAGGARATKRNRPWSLVCYIQGLDKINALRLEWRLKRDMRRKSLPNKLKTLPQIFNYQHWTSNSSSSSDFNLKLFWVDCRPDGLEIPEHIEEHV